MVNHRRLILAFVAASVLGWLCIEGYGLRELQEWLGLTSLFAALIGSAVLAVVFGFSWAVALPRWWYMAPIAGASLDLALMFYGFAHGGANLWPIALGIRLLWMGFAAAGALIRVTAKSRLPKERAAER